MNIGPSIISYKLLKGVYAVNGSFWIFVLRFYFISLVGDFED